MGRFFNILFLFLITVQKKNLNTDGTEGVINCPPMFWVLEINHPYIKLNKTNRNYLELSSNRNELLLAVLDSSVISTLILAITYYFSQKTDLLNKFVVTSEWQQDNRGIQKKWLY